MTDISYSALNLHTNVDTNKFEFMGQQIEVLKYLPAADKYAILIASLDAAKKDGIYDDFMLEVLFHLYLVYKYTNIKFSNEDMENETAVYDALKSNGLIDKVIEAMEPEEYDELVETLNNMVAESRDYMKSASAMVKSLVNDIPKGLKAASDMIKEFDPKQYQAVIDFANAANGNRDINTNVETPKTTVKDTTPIKIIK